jgi:hypothetical protein
VPALESTACESRCRGASPGDHAPNSLGCEGARATPTWQDVSCDSCRRTHEPQSRRQDAIREAVQPPSPAHRGSCQRPHGCEEVRGLSTPAARRCHDRRATGAPYRRYATSLRSPAPGPGERFPTRIRRAASADHSVNARRSGHDRASEPTAARASAPRRPGDAQRASTP